MAVRIPIYRQQTTPNTLGVVPVARAQRISGAVGEGLQQVGAGLQSVEGGLAAQQKVVQRQDEEDAKAWSANALAQAKIDWQKQLVERQQSAQNGAAGFTPGVLNDYDQYSEKLLSNAPTKQAKQFLSERLAALRSSVASSALSFEAKERWKYRISNVDQSIEKSQNLVEADPSQYATTAAEQKAVIGALDVPPDVRRNLMDKSMQGLAVASVIGTMKTDPRAALNRLEGSMPASGPKGDIISSAKAAGVDPKLALTISSIETGNTFSPTAQNPNASSRGMYQFTDSTWAAYGGTPQNRDDPATQAQLGAKLIADNTAALTRDLGRKPQGYEVYLAHLMGAKGAETLLAAPKDAKVVDVVSGYDPKNAQAIVKNNGMSGMTVGQAIDHWKNVFQQHEAEVSNISDTGSSSDLAVSMLPMDKRLQLTRMAQTQVNQQMAQKRGELQGRVRDATASYLSTGTFDNPPSQADFVSAYGPKEGASRYAEFQDVRTLGDNIQAVATLSRADQDRLLASETPAPGTGFADAQKRQQVLTHAIQVVRKQQDDDPAAYTLAHASTVKAAWDVMTRAMDDPGAPAATKQAVAAKYAQAAIAEQERLGIDKPQILPQSYADQIVKQFSDQKQGGENAAQLVQSQASLWGSYWPQVYGQLSAKLPGAALVIGSGLAPAPAAMMAEASTLKRSELVDGMDPATTKDVSDALRSDMTDFQATTAQQAGGTNTFNTIFDNTEKLALMYVRQGKKPVAAANEAYQDVIGGKYQFAGTYRVPSQYNAGEIAAGAGVALTNIDPVNLKLPVSLAGLDETQTRNAYVSAIQTNGYWVTAPDESGLVLYAKGAAVLDAAGKPIRRTWAQLQKAAAGSVQASPAMINPATGLQVE